MTTPYFDQAACLQLATLVQSFPCLWDTRDPGYLDRVVREPAWEDIALTMGHTVAHVKEKWRNLRISYGNYRRRKRANYLTEKMEFLLPVIRKRRPPLNRKVATIVISDDDEETGSDGDSGDCELVEEKEEVAPVAVDDPCGETEQYGRYIAVDARNDDAMFLLSVLPNMRQMTAEQKKIFKVGMLQAADRILKPS